MGKKHIFFGNEKIVHIWGFSEVRTRASDTDSMYVGNDRYAMGYIYVRVSFSCSWYKGYIEGSKNLFFQYFLKIMCYPLNIFFFCLNFMYNFHVQALRIKCHI